jgi:DNA replicative helicase MCM subunit Mcm2 (Cdc46/Mcm family)
VVKGERKDVVLTQEDLVLLRCYIAQISRLKIVIPEGVADEMQNSFVRRRKETGGEGIDEVWFGRRIVVAKGLARVNARESVTREDWEESLGICSQWEMRRK